MRVTAGDARFIVLRKFGADCSFVRLMRPGRDAAAGQVPEVADRTGGGMSKILVIEDDPSQRDVYTKLLYYNGFDVDFADDAETGLRLAQTIRPDVVLIDVVLPGSVNGLVATSMLKRDPDLTGVRVICMSAYDIDDAAVRNAGADDYLRKPIPGDVLVRAIRHFTGWERPD